MPAHKVGGASGHLNPNFGPWENPQLVPSIFALGILFLPGFTYHSPSPLVPKADFMGVIRTPESTPKSLIQYTQISQLLSKLFWPILKLAPHLCPNLDSGLRLQKPLFFASPTLWAFLSDSMSTSIIQTALQFTMTILRPLSPDPTLI